jgi:ABC-2 type transport system ATP-binding protein
LHSSRRVTSEEAVIGLSGVSRRFDSMVAVHELSMEVPAGTILGLIGPSGSGKTTTIRMLTGTLHPSEGTIRVLGEDPLRFTTRTRERIAYMPQSFSLYPDLTARENVGFVAALYGISWFGRGGRIKRALSVVDMWDKRNRLARNLSGGERRRLELACAIVHEPSVLFIDEPTAGLDPILRRSIWDELRQMRDEGRTLLITTQYVAEAEYCDNVALLIDGELVALSDPQGLRRSVYGGDVLQLEADRPVDPDVLANVASVTSVRQAGPRRLVLVVENAGAASPRVTDALNAAGVGLTSLQEYQPNFDDVFTELVARRTAQNSNGSDNAEDEHADA